MKYAFPFLLMLSMLACTSSEKESAQVDLPEITEPKSPLESENAATKKFEGAWFEIEYPSDYTVRPSLESESADGYDSAFFTSPDEQVEFYVFSPQWGGNPIDIYPMLGETKTIDREESEGEGKSFTWYTITIDDNRYTRNYMEVREGEATWTIGLKYPDADRLEQSQI